jgi:hypothetical protein
VEIWRLFKKGELPIPHRQRGRSGLRIVR